MLRVQGLGHDYGGRAALRDVSFVIAPGEKVVLLGCNGSGKSTMLKILDALVQPRAGRWWYGGEEMTPAALRRREVARRFRREVALLFQNPDAMLFNPTVAEEIAFGPRQFDLDDPEGRAARWAGELGLADRLREAPWTLSGGEKQKLCLAALLAVEPRLLLLDEPTSGLDPRSTGWLVDFLQDLDQTVVVSTHNLSLAPELGERALVLGEDHGLLYDGPVDGFVADRELLRAANLVHAHRHRHGGLEHDHFHAHDWD
ncbi:MAG: ABC transporter ATP-binding protein [Candidatus Krumholzibacteriota bacterium]|nr:ABC transporter ATP-binding protein [Candidatus Krumholzibacteriota bacterium]